MNLARPSLDRLAMLCSGMAGALRLGVARHGSVRRAGRGWADPASHDTLWQGEARQGHGMDGQVRQVSARMGMARQASRGLSGLGPASRGMAFLGRRDLARQGSASSGRAWQTRLGPPRYVPAGHVLDWRGRRDQAWRGLAIPVTAGHLKAAHQSHTAPRRAR
jgi:hypothetical protein